MLRIDLRRASPGMVLALPIYNPQASARVLLKVGYELTQAIIDKLVGTQIKSIWVRYPSLDFLDKFLDPQLLQKQAHLVAIISESFEKLQAQSAAKLPYSQYTQAISDVVDHIVSNPKAAVFLGDLSEHDDPMIRRAAAVSYLSVLIGLKVEGYIVKQRKHVDPTRAKEVVNLGLGAMLHDVGVPQLDESIRQHHRDSGDETDPAWREHPAMGFRTVRGHIDPSAATVVLNHHQRFDGSGYCGQDFPLLEGTSIHIFARIASVADQFDRLRHPEGLPDQPTAWALSGMLTTDMAQQFDPQILHALVQVVPPYPPGTTVRLSDGRWAVAIDHNPSNPCRPVVQTIGDPGLLQADGDLPPGHQIDLSIMAPSLAVVQCDGQDVSELNFTPPPWLARTSLACAW